MALTSPALRPEPPKPMLLPSNRMTETPLSARCKAADKPAFSHEAIEIRNVLVVKAHGESDAEAGDTVKIGVAARATHLFNAEGRTVSRTEGVPEAEAA